MLEACWSSLDGVACAFFLPPSPCPPWCAGSAAYMLSKPLKAQAVAGCNNGSCLAVPNNAAFCKAMQQGPNGKAAMYGGIFDVIST